MKYILLLLVILSLFVTSCAPVKVVEPIPTPITPEPIVVQAPPPQPVVVPEVSLSDDARQFKALLSANPIHGITYLYVYTSTSSNIRGTFARYVGEKNLRFDSSIDGVVTQTFFLDNSYIFCNKFDSSWTCSLSDNKTLHDNFYAVTRNDVLAHLTDYVIERVTGEKILGTDTTCYHVIKPANVTVTYCFNANSVPYLVTVEEPYKGFTAVTELRATTYTSVVPADKFAPPKVVTG